MCDWLAHSTKGPRDPLAASPKRERGVEILDDMTKAVSAHC